MEAGAQVAAFDPAVKALSAALAAVEVCPDLAAAVRGADAVAVCTEWPQFRQADWGSLAKTLSQPVFVDANRFLEQELKNIPRLEYLSVGRS